MMYKESSQVALQKNRWLIHSQIFLTAFIFVHNIFLSLFHANCKASVSNLGQLSGSLLAGYLASVYGRKPILLLLYGVSAGSFLVATFSKGLTSVLIVSRILQGFGIITTVNQVGYAFQKQ